MALEQDKLYKLSAVSDSIGISRQTLAAWARDGLIPAVKAGRNWFLSGQAANDIVKHGVSGVSQDVEKGAQQ